MRKTLVSLVLVLVATLAAAPTAAQQDAALDAAQALFELYVELSGKFDPDVADLYADGAKVYTDREYDDGTRTLEVSGAEWKDFVRQAMPIAKAKGDLSEYTEVTYRREGRNVRISATRNSVWRGYGGPYTLLVGADDDGRWRILEERVYTKP